MLNRRMFQNITAALFATALVMGPWTTGMAQSTPTPDAPKSDTPPAKVVPKDGNQDASKPAPKTEKIEVSGRRSATDVRRDSSASKIVITREDIEQYGDSNLGEVMRRLPGVTSGGRPGRPGGPGMRGMGGGFTQILIDGERTAPGFSIEQITPEQVERIEILRAPTAETGTRAIAGTINIVLREPLRTRNNDIRAGLQSEQGRYSPSLSWSRNEPFSPTGTYNLTLSTSRSDQITETAGRSTYLDLPGNRINLDQQSFSSTNGERDSVFFSSRFQWRLGPGEQFSIQPFLVRHASTNHTDGTLSQTIGTLPAPFATSRADADSEFNVARLMTTLVKRLDPNTRMELRGTAGQFKSDGNSTLRERAANGSPVLTQSTDSHTKDQSWNLVGKLMYSWGDGKHSLVGGWEYENIKRSDNATTILNGAPLLADFGSQIDVSTKRKALYIQDEWDPSPQFSTYFGIRWEEINTNSRTVSNPVSNKSSVITPLAHGVWRFASPRRDQIRMSLTQSYRAPSTQNLVARPSLNTLFPVPGSNTSITPDRAGNANLKPELANGIDVAYENYFEGGGTLAVNLFTRHITDLIRSVTALENVSWATSPRYVNRPQNLGKARTSGIEFDAKFRLPELITNTPAINLRANLSLFDSKVDAVNGPNNRIGEQPRATGNFGADYRFRGSPISIGGSVNWVPAHELQLTNTQLQKVSTKRVLDAYVLWTVNSSIKVRLAFSNLLPNDVINTNVLLQGSEQQTVTTTGLTKLSTALRLEIRL